MVSATSGSVTSEESVLSSFPSSPSISSETVCSSTGASEIYPSGGSVSEVCLRLNPSLFLSISIFRIFTLISCPSLTTSLGLVITASLNSVIWIRPSIESSSLAKAPKLAILVTVASTTSPTWYLSNMVSQGSGCSRRRLRAIFIVSLSIRRTYTSNSSPTFTKSSGDPTILQDISEMWISPSAPPKSTNAPKLLIPVTMPLRISPSSNFSISSAFCSSLCSCKADLSEKIALFRDLLTSSTLTVRVLPMKSFPIESSETLAPPGSEDSCLKRSLEIVINWDIGTKPWTLATSRIHPPRLNPAMTPSTGSSWSISFWISLQPSSPLARSTESIGPSLESGRITKAIKESPSLSFTISSLLMVFISPIGTNPSSLWPMSRKIPSESTRITDPSTTSPLLKILKSIASSSCCISCGELSWVSGGIHYFHSS